ncbi:MAG: hypothetical protein VYA34_11405 [Myxococcota bacterium]|nr:hypothetical protein [Myxococcota bacterium]
MSDRVQDRREAQITEQKRLEKETSKKDTQKSSDRKFSQTMKNAASETTTRSNQPPSTNRPKGAASKNSSAQALAARKGIASQKFSDTLFGTGEKNLNYSKDLSSNRAEQKDQERLEFNDSKQQDSVKELNENDPLAAISERQSQSGQGGSFGQPHDEGHQPETGSLDTIDNIGNPSGTKNVKQSQGAGQAGQIPPAILEKLVNQVMAGVDEIGQPQFIIELNQETLQGARIEIKRAEDGIEIIFTSPHKDIQNLIKSNENRLHRAFHHRGLNLNKVSVSS